MAECLTIAAFAASLLLCVAADAPILIALGLGLLLFCGYGLWRGHSARELLSLALSGVRSVRNILVTLLLIGVVTALWRAGGTVSYIVYYASFVCEPHAMVLVSFVLCCLFSSLTGTALGTAATMGVVCVTMAGGMGVPAVLAGGAVLAGCYFGDRCSPMSTSALLVSTLTRTDLFRNIGAMAKASAVPFAATCLIYVVAGLCLDVHQGTYDVRSTMASGHLLHPGLLAPAAAVVLLSAFKVDMRVTLGISALASAATCLILQNMAPAGLLATALLGFAPQSSAVSPLLAGGGALSMAQVLLIVGISSCYAGLFSGTGLLDGLQGALERLAQRTSPFFAVLLASILSAVISCNQALAILLTHQLGKGMGHDPEQLALAIEDTAVVIAPLVPWSVAATAALAPLNLPLTCLFTCCYLYLLPLWHLAADRFRASAASTGRGRRGTTGSPAPCRRA